MTSVVLYLLTRATMMSPGKGETRVCGYNIYIYIYINFHGVRAKFSQIVTEKVIYVLMFLHNILTKLCSKTSSIKLDIFVACCQSYITLANYICYIQIQI